MVNEEEKTIEESKDSDNGSENRDAPKTLTLVDEANIAAERLEKANARHAELIRQEQELQARRALGGETEQGAAPAKKEVDDKDYAQAALKGNIIKG